MIPLDTLLVFISASVALGLAPGPDNLFVLTQSALYGRRAGLLVVAGLCSGIVLHTAAVALGVAAMVQGSPTAFTALKLLGAGYLLFLAWKAATAPAVQPGAAQPAPRPWLRGLVMNATNPKVLLFFLAFLPQFVDATRGAVWAQIMMLGALFIVTTAMVFGAIALASGQLGGWLRRSPRASLWLNRVAAAVFVALAVKLLTSSL